VPRLLGSQDVIDVEDVVAVFIVISVILDTLARLGEDSARVTSSLVVEAVIAQLVGRR
jgi:hypothetical protein